jgi:predicted metal-dependent hydrolase
MRQTSKSIIEHPEIGEITIARNPRARRISVSVRPPGAVRLTLPAAISVQEGVRFLESKLEWIEAARERIRTKTAPAIIAPPFSTRSHTLELRQADTSDIRVRIADRHITVTHPHRLPHTDSLVQMAIKKGIEEAWRIEAKEFLPGRIATIARNLSLRYNSLTIRNTVSKWGSCSTQNDISLSIHLMRLPDVLIDYVIVHELCHTIHKNHGQQFHALLSTLTTGQHPTLHKQLRTYHTRW